MIVYLCNNLSWLTHIKKLLLLQTFIDSYHKKKDEEFVERKKNSAAAYIHVILD